MGESGEDAGVGFVGGECDVCAVGFKRAQQRREFRSGVRGYVGIAAGEPVEGLDECVHACHASRHIAGYGVDFVVSDELRHGVEHACGDGLLFGTAERVELAPVALACGDSASGDVEKAGSAGRERAVGAGFFQS